jgi:hypothetical protein
MQGKTLSSALPSFPYHQRAPSPTDANVDFQYHTFFSLSSIAEMRKSTSENGMTPDSQC